MGNAEHPDQPAEKLPEELRGLTYDQASPEQVAQVRAYMRAKLAAADARWTDEEREQQRIAFLRRRRVILRAVLDTSAIRAYSTGSIDVGELIGEFSDEGVEFGIPALCLIEAATDADEHAAAILAVLTEHPHAEWLPLDHHDWRRVAAAAHLLGDIARASAALPVVHRQADYLVTADPDAYPGIRTIDIEP